MGRFRYAGSNHEGRSWTASLAVIAFGDQISAMFPPSHATDGTVASAAHDKVSPNSDHRPHPFKGPGIVRAIDVGARTPAERSIPEKLRLSRDKRIKYVIFDGRIFNDDTWAWRDYDGANPHATHYHVSFNTFADNDSSKFQLSGGGDDDMALTPEDLNKIADAVWFRLITHPVTGTQRGAQALLADAVRYAADAAAKQAGSGATPDQIADKLSQRLAS